MKIGHVEIDETWQSNGLGETFDDLCDELVNELRAETAFLKGKLNSQRR